jgi:hypothetical protein
MIAIILLVVPLNAIVAYSVLLLLVVFDDLIVLPFAREASLMVLLQAVILCLDEVSPKPLEGDLDPLWALATYSLYGYH